MTENIENKEKDRRDWTLLIFILPLGILLMLLVGELAIRAVPLWSVQGNMKSNLNPETASDQQVQPVHPLSLGILTPMSWFSTFLTPNPGSSNGPVSFAPFVVFEPSATPSPTKSAAPPPSPSPTETPIVIPSSTVMPSPVALRTQPPLGNHKQKNNNPPPPAPSPTATPATPTATATPAPILSTIDPSLNQMSPPAALGVNVPPDGPPAGNYSNIGEIPSGNYVVVNLGGTPVHVSASPDGNYDMTVYEYNNGGTVYLDQMSVGISQLQDGSQYYEVYNWGNNTPDANTNVGTIAATVGAEVDNQPVSPTDLYPNPGTGILIDVDKATSNPPAGDYPYVVVISPKNGGDPAQVDSIVVTEVPIPATPTP